MPRPTIRSIADRLNLSSATISLALRGHPRIPQKTQELVRRTAEELGYRPDPSISRLMTHIRSARQVESLTTVALLNSTSERVFSAQSSYHRNLWEGIEEQGDELGYKVEGFWTKECGMSAKRLSQILENRGIQGLILPPFKEFGTTLDINWPAFASVTTGYSLLNPRLNRIVGNQRQAIFTSIYELLKTGHKRIAAVWSEVYDSRLTFISSSVFAWFQMYLPANRRIPFFHMKSWDSRVLEDWVRKQKPDAIVTHIPYLSDILQKTGIQIPEDISIVVQGTTPSDTRLTGCYVSPLDVGRRLMKMLDSQLRQNEFGIPTLPVTVLMDMQWHDGETLVERGQPDKLVELFNQTAW